MRYIHADEMGKLDRDIHALEQQLANPTPKERREHRARDRRRATERREALEAAEAERLRRKCAPNTACPSCQETRYVVLNTSRPVEYPVGPDGLYLRLCRSCGTKGRSSNMLLRGWWGGSFPGALGARP